MTTPSMRFKRTAPDILHDVYYWALKNKVNPADAIHYAFLLRLNTNSQRELFYARESIEDINSHTSITQDDWLWIRYQYGAMENQAAIQSMNGIATSEQDAKRIVGNYPQVDWTSFPKVDEMWEPEDASLGSYARNLLKDDIYVTYQENHQQCLHRIFHEWLGLKRLVAEKLKNATSKPEPRPKLEPKDRKKKKAPHGKAGNDG